MDSHRWVEFQNVIEFFLGLNAFLDDGDIIAEGFNYGLINSFGGAIGLDEAEDIHIDLDVIEIKGGKGLEVGVA